MLKYSFLSNKYAFPVLNQKYKKVKNLNKVLG